jgi:Zn-dependent protease
VKWFLRAESFIVLWGLGGLCVHGQKPPPKTRLGISLMGPAFEAVLGGLSFLALLLLPETAPHALVVFVSAMVWINLVWVAANLLPILPLDGGQALWAALELRIPRARAYGIVRRVSVVVGAGGAAAAIHYGYPFAAAIAILLVLQNLAPRSVA